MDRHIGLLISHLQGGGAERVFVNLAGAFAERGYRVDLVVFRKEGPLVNEVPATVRLVDCALPHLGFGLPAVMRYLRREKPPVLLTTLRAPNVFGPLARDLAWSGTRVVVREPSTFNQLRASKRSLRTAVLERLMKVAYQSADQIIANSQDTAADLISSGFAVAGKVKVIHNPLDIGRIQSTTSESLDDPWFVSGAPPVILTIGRLVPAKDFPTFLRCIDVLRRSRRIRAVILGEGPLRPQLEGMVRELGLDGIVALPGFVSNPHRYTARAAVLALSSRWEGFGNVLVEALALGTPVVATDCPGGPTEILCHGKYGELVPVGDAQAMAEAIGRALDTRPDPERLRGRAANFSLDAITPQYLECLGFSQ